MRVKRICLAFTIILIITVFSNYVMAEIETKYVDVESGETTYIVDIVKLINNANFYMVNGEAGFRDDPVTISGLDYGENRYVIAYKIKGKMKFVNLLINRKQPANALDDIIIKEDLTIDSPGNVGKIFRKDRFYFKTSTKYFEEALNIGMVKNENYIAEQIKVEVWNNGIKYIEDSPSYLNATRYKRLPLIVGMNEIFIKVSTENQKPLYYQFDVDNKNDGSRLESFDVEGGQLDKPFQSNYYEYIITTTGSAVTLLPKRDYYKNYKIYINSKEYSNHGGFKISVEDEETPVDLMLKNEDGNEVHYAINIYKTNMEKAEPIRFFIEGQWYTMGDLYIPIVLPKDQEYTRIKVDIPDDELLLVEGQLYKSNVLTEPIKINMETESNVKKDITGYIIKNNHVVNRLGISIYEAEEEIKNVTATNTDTENVNALGQATFEKLVLNSGNETYEIGAYDYSTERLTVNTFSYLQYNLSAKDGQSFELYNNGLLIDRGYIGEEGIVSGRVPVIHGFNTIMVRMFGHGEKSTTYMLDVTNNYDSASVKIKGGHFDRVFSPDIHHYTFTKTTSGPAVSLYAFNVAEEGAYMSLNNELVESYTELPLNMNKENILSILHFNNSVDTYYFKYKEDNVESPRLLDISINGENKMLDNNNVPMDFYFEDNEPYTIKALTTSGAGVIIDGYLYENDETAEAISRNSFFRNDGFKVVNKQFDVENYYIKETKVYTPYHMGLTLSAPEHVYQYDDQMIQKTMDVFMYSENDVKLYLNPSDRYDKNVFKNVNVLYNLNDTLEGNFVENQPKYININDDGMVIEAIMTQNKKAEKYYYIFPFKYKGK